VTRTVEAAGVHEARARLEREGFRVFNVAPPRTSGVGALTRLGMQEELEPTKPLTGSAQDLGYALPRSLQQSLDSLEDCTPLHEVFGKRFCDTYIAVKRREYQTFLRVISSWEREFLLLNV
jgi:glutamine synthetase